MYGVITGSTVTARRFALVAIEHLLIVLSVVLAALLRFGVPEPAFAAGASFCRSRNCMVCPLVGWLVIGITNRNLRKTSSCLIVALARND